jgi:hypothetical protein
VEDPCQKTELALLDASVDESSMRIGRVQGYENSSSDSGCCVEFLGYELLIVPKWSEQPLMYPVERDVMVSGGDHNRYILESPEVHSGLLILSDLGPLRQVSSQDDDIGRHPSRQLEKTVGYVGPMGFAEVYVRPV